MFTYMYTHINLVCWSGGLVRLPTDADGIIGDSLQDRVKKIQVKSDIEHVLPWRSLFNKMREPCQDIHKVSGHPVSWGRHFKSHLLKECAWPITHFAQAHYLYVGRSTPSWHIRARIKFISGKGNALSGCLCICLWRGMHGHIQPQNQTICWISRVRDA
jgi:hypothetical protein